MPSYEIRVRKRDGGACAYQANRMSDIDAVRTAHSIAANGDSIEVWKGMERIYISKGWVSVRSQTARIRDLNDTFRANVAEGKCIMTAGISQLGNPFATAAVAAARAYGDFTRDNDPDGEHDFGTFRIGEERLCWKIDYYDPTQRFGSRDPSDPAETQRVLTIMLAEEL